MKKGFTLIELLAVIVILAIIALIATPVILNVIEDSRTSSKKRSIELYANAVENALVKIQFDNKLTVGKYTPITDSNGKKITNGSDTINVDYDGEPVECDINVYESGNIYLDNCNVGGTSIDYTYGTKE